MQSRHISLLFFFFVLFSVTGTSLYYLKIQVYDVYWGENRESKISHGTPTRVSHTEKTQANLKAVGKTEPVLSSATQEKNAANAKEWTESPIAADSIQLATSTDQTAIDVNKRLIEAMDAIETKRTEIERLINDGETTEGTVEINTKRAASVNDDLLNALDSSLDEKVAERSAN